jgi:RNA polymerase sigma-70 factor (ECF subfamily)
VDDEDDGVLLARSGEDPEAFRQLYRRHATGLLAYLRRGSGDAETSVELLAETMALAYEHREQHDPDRGPVVGWLFGIARHQLHQLWRTRRAELAAVRRLGVLVPSVDEDSVERIDAMVDATGRSADLTAALAALGPAERQAVLLRVAADRTYPEVAEALMCTPNAARVRVHRGLARLRTRLEDQA